MARSRSPHLNSSLAEVVGVQDEHLLSQGVRGALYSQGALATGE